MSAIAGAIFTDGRQMSDETLGGMVRAMPPRGFDGITRWREGPAGLIRLAHATTPEAVGEVQPHVSPRTGAVICFDGRLDNRADLLEALGASARQFQAAPDCEIVLALFERKGEDVPALLVGDFAFAVWQPSERRLFCARSAMGWRPLLWTYDGKTFGFSTEPRSLVKGLGLPRRINEGAVGEFLAARFVSQTDTFWQGVYRLPQGGALVLADGHVRQWHWHHEHYADHFDMSEADHIARFSELFDQALIAVNRSSTAVMSQLSGGLDSSSVVCRSTELHRAGRISRQVGAITARFPGQPHDETPWSSAVEHHLGITAQVVGSSPFDADAARHWSGQTYQLPIRPNALDTMAGVCERLHADGTRVLLTGEGGDDWLNGNFTHFPDMVLAGRWGTIIQTARSQWPGRAWSGVIKDTLIHSFRPLVDSRYRNQILNPSVEFSVRIPDWIRPEWGRRAQLPERWAAEALPVKLPTFAQRQRYQVYLLAQRHIHYENVQALTESQGIELRHPFHDLRLTRFLMGASGKILNRNGQKKYLLREAMRGTLPEMVRTRTTKAMFVGHTVDAISTVMRQRRPQDMLCAQMGWIVPERIAAMHAPFQSWRDNGSQGRLPDTRWGPVWLTIALDIWLENAFGD